MSKIDPRRYAAIHIAAKEAGLIGEHGEDEQYRAWLWGAFRVRSATELSEIMLAAAVDALRARPVGRAQAAPEPIVAPVVAHPAMTVILPAPEEELDPGDIGEGGWVGEPESLALPEEIALIQRLASPSAQRDVDWTTLTRDQAGVWIEELQPRRRSK